MAYSVKALAERWQCSRKHIYNLIDDGHLTAFSIGTRRGTRISEQEVERWESGEKQPTVTGASRSGDRPAGGLPTGQMRALVNGRV